MKNDSSIEIRSPLFDQTICLRVRIFLDCVLQTLYDHIRRHCAHPHEASEDDTPTKHTFLDSLAVFMLSVV